MDEFITTEKTKLASYKSVCAKLGFIMCVFFICKLLSYFVTSLLAQVVGETGETAFFVLQGIISTMLVFLVPLLVAAILFKSFAYYNGKLVTLYKKPEKLAKKLGNFPAMYGFGYGIALVTMLVNLFISRFTKDFSRVAEEIFQPTTIAEPSTNIAYVIGMVILLVVIAPIFEELLFRGIMYDALAPYGNGVAIVVTSLLFGMAHGSLNMLFYTTALGFALGYIRYATNSLFVVTILHALLNSVAAIMLVVTSLAEITNHKNMLVNTLNNIYLLVAFVLIIAGLAAFIKKLPVIKKYKIENTWNEISGAKKILLFFVSAPVLLMLILAFDEHANNMFLEKIIGLF
ncbi:MAG: CPBP family intramembrane metalloprotease [Oscillospiraceae bacterium]|nr:CPBP family intramembrane metalloprotease [Oscillospiraceae bacterium]